MCLAHPPSSTFTGQFYFILLFLILLHLYINFPVLILSDLDFELYHFWEMFFFFFLCCLCLFFCKLLVLFLQLHNVPLLLFVFLFYLLIFLSISLPSLHPSFISFIKFLHWPKQDGTSKHTLYTIVLGYSLSSPLMIYYWASLKYFV